MNKKKKTSEGDAIPAPVEGDPQSLTQEQKDEIGNAAAKAAKPFGVEETMVTPATRLEFGDYQCNAAVGLSKNVAMAPMDCAIKIVEGLRPLIGDIMEEPEIAGPGFINLRFKKDHLEKSVKSMAKDTKRRAVPLAG
jgi:arginyl-tRNA synthetase